MGQREMFSIRQMIELTGLSEFTIRGWENRYSAFSPRRGQTGRRLYRRSDVERALLLRELIKRGHKIGKVASLTKQNLQTVFDQSDRKNQELLVGKKPTLATKALELLALQKWDELEDLIRKFKVRDARRTIDEFFLPVLQGLAVKVNAGLVSIAQEHVLSSLMKEKIYSVIGALNSGRKNESLRFVLAAPEGDYHEMGLLLGHLLIRSYGFVSIYLGGHTPARDLAETALRFNATHLLIVSTVSKSGGAFHEPLTYINEVQKKCGTRLQILFAGNQAPISQKVRSALSIIGDFQSLDKYLKTLPVKFQQGVK